MIDKIKKDYTRSSKSKKALLVIVIYRLGNELVNSKLNKHVKKIFLLVLRVVQYLLVEVPFGVEIPFSTTIGKGLRLTHINGIVMHRNVVLGENCTVFHQVTLGANEHRVDFKEAPKLGDNVYIGAGAKIIGNITIGNNVKIGANAVVVRDISENSTVICKSQTVINKSHDMKKEGIV